MIHVIINPSAGQDVAVLATMNSVFQPAGVDWTVSITQGAGDARKQAKEAVAGGADMVAVYGGDGTVVEAASGLLGSDVPLGVLPGGTANVVAQGLGIPTNLKQACQLLIDESRCVRTLDLGQVNDEYFLLRVGLGTEAQITEGANRDLKDRIGFLAYVWSAAQSLINVQQATYHLTIDGKEQEIEGITCGIMNSGNVGINNLRMAPDIRMDDGLLDVVVVQDANLPALTELVTSIMSVQETDPESDLEADELPSSERFSNAVRRFKGKEITVRVQPAQVVQYDGEILQDAQDTEDDKTVVHCKILPSSIGIYVPENARTEPNDSFLGTDVRSS